MDTDNFEVDFRHLVEPDFPVSVNRLTEIVIGCSYNVSNNLGNGFLEKVYENALAIELSKAGLNFVQQHHLDVLYDGQVVGQYCADFLVENVSVVEIKALSGLTDSHKAQLINYLKATNNKVGLLINFGKPKVEVKRAVL